MQCWKSVRQEIKELYTLTFVTDPSPKVVLHRTLLRFVYYQTKMTRRCGLRDAFMLEFRLKLRCISNWHRHHRCCQSKGCILFPLILFFDQTINYLLTT